MWSNRTVSIQKTNRWIGPPRFPSYQQAPLCSQRELKSHKLLFVSCFFYILTIVLFSASLPRNLQYAVVAIAFVFSIRLMHRDYVQAVYLLILVMSIGPVVYVGIPNLGNFNLADVFLIFLSLFFFIKYAPKRIYFGPFDRSVKFLAMLFVASIVLCDDRKSVLVSALSIVQFALVYIITINVIKTHRQANNLIVMIALGVTVGAALHLVFYSRGLSLWLASDSSGLKFLQTGEIGDHFSVATARNQFFRTSHFYGPFIVPCGVAIVFGVMSLWLGSIYNRWYLFYWILVIGIVMSSLLITGNRTILLSCVISVVGLFAIRFTAAPVTFWRRRFLPVIFLMLICIVGAFIVQRSMLNDSQRQAYLEAIFGDASSSMSQRFSMWSHACHVFSENPKILLFGVGPDLAWRNPDNAKIGQIMFIPAMQFQVPSYHNFYFDLVLNFGIMFFLAFLGIIVGTIRQLVKTFWHGWDEVSGACLCAILMWLISWITVSMAWGKVLFILAQLLALSHLVGFGLLADKDPAQINVVFLEQPRKKVFGRFV